MYKIIDIFGCQHKDLYTFDDAIAKLRQDMYLSDKDIQQARLKDKYTFIYGFISSHIERV